MIKKKTRYDCFVACRETRFARRMASACERRQLIEARVYNKNVIEKNYSWLDTLINNICKLF